MPGKIAAGTISVLIDNVPYDAVGEFELEISKVSSVPEAGSDGHVANIITNEIPGVTGTIRDSGGLTVAMLDGLENVPVQVQCVNGKTYVFDACNQVLKLSVNTGNSNIPIEFRSMTRSIKEVGVSS